MALYLEKIALFNSTESFAVELVNVMEGVNGGAKFGYNSETETVKVASNRTQTVSQSHTLDIMVIDDTQVNSILTEWANTPEFLFKAVGYSGDTFLLWDEAVNLTFPRQYDQIVTRKVNLTYKSVSGYAGVQPSVKCPVYVGHNLLAVYKVWEGNSSLLNGFAVSDDLTVSQSAGSQVMTRTADVGAFLESELLLFPFEGVTLTASMTTTAHTGLGEFGLRYYDSSFALIDQSITSFVGGGTVRRTVNGTTPADTYYIRFYVSPGLTLGNSTTFNTPMIGLNYNTEFST